MELVQKRLHEKYDTTPTHSIDDIILLATNFPENIKLFICEKESTIHAGVIIFETETTAHCQYIATSDFGRTNGALDFLIDHLLINIYSNKCYFDFGTSYDDNEIMINLGLHQNKESYGARTFTYDTYLVNLETSENH